MKIYIFNHVVVQRIEGMIIDYFTNTYSVMAEETHLAFREVPYGSILKVIKNLDGSIVEDFRVPNAK